MEEKWRYDGKVWDFIDMIKWCIVARELAEENADNLIDVLKSPEKVKQKACALGLSDRAVAEEILSIGEKTRRLFRDFDEEEGKTVEERPELFLSGRKPRNMQEVFWIIDSNCGVLDEKDGND